MPTGLLSVPGSTVCWDGVNSRGYHGNVSISRSGITCQAWSAQVPHSHINNKPELFPYDNSVAEARNYCRDPDFEYDPWCYTISANLRWEFCDIRLCSGTVLTNWCMHFCVVIEAPLWKRWAAALAFPGSIPDGGGTLFNCKRSSIAHSLSLSPYRRSDVLEIPLKRRKKSRHPSLCCLSQLRIAKYITCDC